MRCVVHAMVLVFAVAVPASGAGPFDGEWSGYMTAEPDSRSICGFDRTPFRARVEDGRFIGMAVDGGETQRTFEGTVASDGTVKIWGLWGITGEYTLPMTGGGPLTGTFSEMWFRGTFFAQERTGSVCMTRILLER